MPIQCPTLGPSSQTLRVCTQQRWVQRIRYEEDLACYQSRVHVGAIWVMTINDALNCPREGYVIIGPNAVTIWCLFGCSSRVTTRWRVIHQKDSNDKQDPTYVHEVSTCRLKCRSPTQNPTWRSLPLRSIRTQSKQRIPYIGRNDTTDWGILMLYHVNRCLNTYGSHNAWTWIRNG